MTTPEVGFEGFLVAFDAWLANREQLCEMEESGRDYPDPDGWEASDDEAVELLREAARLIATWLQPS